MQTSTLLDAPHRNKHLLCQGALSITLAGLDVEFCNRFTRPQTQLYHHYHHNMCLANTSHSSVVRWLGFLIVAASVDGSSLKNVPSSAGQPVVFLNSWRWWTLEVGWRHAMVGQSWKEDVKLSEGNFQELCTLKCMLNSGAVWAF